MAYPQPQPVILAPPPGVVAAAPGQSFLNVPPPPVMDPWMVPAHLVYSEPDPGIPPMVVQPQPPMMGATPLMVMQPPPPPVMVLQPPPVYVPDQNYTLHFHAPAHESENDLAWREHREKTLREWGHKREDHLRRAPVCLLDQLVSGSGLFPPRLLDESWWLPEELAMIHNLEMILARTGHAHSLARDMMTPRIYNIRVKIILDNSGSMGLDMMGENTGSNDIESKCSYISVAGMRFYDKDQAYQAMWQNSMPRCSCLCQCCAGCCGPNGACLKPPVPQKLLDNINPTHKRWYFARDHLAKWLTVYRTMGIEPDVYLLNPLGKFGAKGKNNSIRLTNTDINAIFNHPPGGSTPLTEVLLSALSDHHDENPGKALFLLLLTDGEANSPATFNTLLDSIQNGAHGDVQLCINGLSLRPEDLDWFENEECDDSRIRTVEAFEIEQQQMLRREVIGTEGGYTFDMHVFRTLVTNFFPSDYDVEAPAQSCRHRCYATVHSKDRWWSQNCCNCCNKWSDLKTGQTYAGGASCQGPCGLYCCLSGICGVMFCTPLFLGTACCCFGYCQGQECCKCRTTECCEAVCGLCEGE